MQYSKITKFDRIAKTITIADGTILAISDPSQLQKLDAGLYRYVATDGIGRVSLVDRAESPSCFSAIEKRDGRSFNQVHSLLRPNRTGPRNPGTSGRSTMVKIGGLTDDESAVGAAITALHQSDRGLALSKAARRDARKDPNARCHRALVKCAQGSYSTPEQARGALVREGVNLGQLGISE